MSLERSKLFLRSFSNAYGIVYLFLITCVASIAAYYEIFGWVVNFWDDEGTMIWRVKQYRAGLKLYDQIYSSYGPVYFLYNGFVRSISRTAVTYDSTRMTTVVVWVACALIAALIVLRFTKSLVLATVAHLYIFANLAFFGHEPGHPQELCMLLLLGLVASGLLVGRPGHRAIAMILAGVITAALLLIKMNVGVFMVLGVALAILFQLPSTVFSRVGKVAAAGAALMLPLMLMTAHLDDSRTRVFCFEVTASIAALLPGLIYAGQSDSLRLRDGWTAALSFVGMVAIVWLAALAQGISSSGMFNALVWANLRVNVLQRSWYYPLEMAPIWVPWAVGGLAAALCFDRAVRREPRQTRVLLARFKLIFGVLVLLLAAVRPGLPTYTRIALTLMPGFVTPYCWLLLYAPSPETESQSFPRILLSAIAVLQTLVAYPLAGSQAFFTRSILTIVGVVAIGDFLAALAPSLAKNSIDLRPAMRAAAITVLLFLPFKYMMLANQDRRTYQSRLSLAFPGAKRIHVPETQARAYQWLVQNIQDRCDIVMGMPGFLSLNLWSATTTPSLASAGDWMDGLDNQQQSEVVSTLSRYPGACIIYSPDLINATPVQRDMNALPLARYILGNFKPVGAVEMSFAKRDMGLRQVRYYFMVRNDRNLVLAPPIRTQASGLMDADSSRIVSQTKKFNR